ncbi:hypothetical protein [Aquimarina sp. MMG016]|uniref:hypothetical protein n=1 Tax=Aquimarina sp. MMG016 TaxID=2822690 RepID=UPI001B39F50C|nr:hypothetical protein [Aquimarina sp. MMG016]MBQ4819608.1 hypothetical protein [Aquimarina sp. MMG016]
MKNSFILITIILTLLSCQKNHTIADFQIGAAKHIIGDHYNAEIEICLEENLGYSNIYLKLFFTLLNGEKIEMTNMIYTHSTKGFNVDKKCFEFGTRSFFNKRHKTKIDIANMKKLSVENIKKVKIEIWDEILSKRHSVSVFKIN